MNPLILAPPRPTFAALSHNGHYVITPIGDIVHCESDGNYSTVHLSDGSRVVVCRKLKKLEELLPSECFVRVHHSHIVNLRFVKKIMKCECGQLVLTDGSQVDVSRRKRQELMDRLMVI